MCYSGQIQDAYDKYVRKWGADIDLDEFVRLYFNEAPLASPRSPMSRQPKSLQRVTIDASSQSSPSMSMHGLIPIPKTSRRSMPSSTIASGHITNIGWRHSPVGES